MIISQIARRRNVKAGINANGSWKTSCQCCLLGEAADVPALFLTRERELGDPRLTELQDGLPSGPCTALRGLTGVWSITGTLQSHYFVCTGVKHLAQLWVCTAHSQLQHFHLSCWISCSWLDLVQCKQKYSQFLQTFCCIQVNKNQVHSWLLVEWSSQTPISSSDVTGGGEI